MVQLCYGKRAEEKPIERKDGDNMAHIHSVYDTDSHFKIDPITKKIECEAQKKVRLTKGDHDSERFTFECPRYVEGHDMMECNVIEVHYINIDATDKTKVSKSFFPVDDKQLSEESENIVIFSWLIKGTATKYVGTLGFSVRFACITNAPTIDYQWLTDINNSVSVGDTIFNSEYIAEEYEDALAAWKAEIEEAINKATVSDEQVAQAVENYLAENPVQSGATTEQAQQIETNRTDIETIKRDIGNVEILLEAI